LAARSNYLSADRPDCQYSAKEICRFMAQLTQLGIEALKRLWLYLCGKRKLIYKYKWQRDVEGIAFAWT